MARSNEFIGSNNGASANSILIKGAQHPTADKSIILPIKVNEEGSLCITEEAQTDNGFDILTSGSYKSWDMGTGWNKLKVINSSDAIIKASSSIADDFASDGHYNTGTFITASADDEIDGDFVQIAVHSGMLMAYRTEHTDVLQFYTLEDEKFLAADGDVLLVK